MKTVAEFAEEISPFRAMVAGAIRRMVITFTDDVLWQLTGVRFPDGTIETRQVEPFTGIGHYARPPAGVEAEAAVVMDGDSKSPMIVGVRDEATRAKVAGDLAADETATFTSKSIAHHKADGTIELRGFPQVLPPEKMLKAETYRTAEDALNGATSTMLDGLAAIFGLLAAATPTLTGSPAAITAFNAAVTPVALLALTEPYAAALTAFNAAAATYLARVGKVE